MVALRSATKSMSLKYEPASEPQVVALRSDMAALSVLEEVFVDVE